MLTTSDLCDVVDCNGANALKLCSNAVTQCGEGRGELHALRVSVCVLVSEGFVHEVDQWCSAR